VLAVLAAGSCRLRGHPVGVVALRTGFAGPEVVGYGIVAAVVGPLAGIIVTGDEPEARAPVFRRGIVIRMVTRAPLVIGCAPCTGALIHDITDGYGGPPAFVCRPLPAQEGRANSRPPHTGGSEIRQGSSGPRIPRTSDPARSFLFRLA